jgi:hypothetical protein
MNHLKLIRQSNFFTISFNIYLLLCLIYNIALSYINPSLVFCKTKGFENNRIRIFRIKNIKTLLKNKLILKYLI